jgi:hypothetical protein
MRRKLTLAAVIVASLAAVAIARPFYSATVLELTAVQATGSGTAGVLSAGFRRATVTVQVAAYAGWGGTLIFTPYESATDTVGGVPTTVIVGDLTASGTTGVADYSVAGAYSVGVAVTGNDKALEVIVIGWDHHGE